MFNTKEGTSSSEFCASYGILNSLPNDPILRSSLLLEQLFCISKLCPPPDCALNKPNISITSKISPSGSFCAHMGVQFNPDLQPMNLGTGLRVFSFFLGVFRKSPYFNPDPCTPHVCENMKHAFASSALTCRRQLKRHERRTEPTKNRRRTDLLRLKL